MATSTITPVGAAAVGEALAPPAQTMAEIGRLGFADGLTKANLGVDFRDGEGPDGHEGKHFDYDLGTITDDLTVPHYAEIRPDGALRLTAYVGAAHTEHSSHSRTEFRELGPDGKDKAKWSSKSGRHYVWCRGAVIKLPQGRQRCCIAQIHTSPHGDDHGDDLCMIMVDKGSNVESTFGDDGRPGRLTSNLVLGEVHEWMIELVRDGSETVINYYWDDMTTPQAHQRYDGGDGLYAKWGNYQQSGTDFDDEGETCVIDLYDCEVWHTGYPEPAARHGAASFGKKKDGPPAAGAQTLGVGGIATPAPGPKVVLTTADSTSTLKITEGGRTYDGQGHTVKKIEIEADDVVVQNFFVRGGTNCGIMSTGSNNVIRNNDIGQIKSDGDVNGITFFGDGTQILFNNIGATVELLSGPPDGSHTDGIQTWNTPHKRSSSNVVIRGNRIVGPDASDDGHLHQGVMAEGKDSTDDGGGGTGVSQTWTVSENFFRTFGNQCLKFDDIHDVTISKNTFAGTANKIVAKGSLSTGVDFRPDNIVTGHYGAQVGD